MTSIYQGDDTGAFNGSFLTINLSVKNNEGEIIPVPHISKAEIRIGCTTKTFINPEFPLLKINLTSQETAALKAVNNIYMAVWDENGLKQTCEGTITFNAKTRRV